MITGGTAKPVATKKVINFQPTGLVRSIQDYANKNHDGNFTAAVIELCQDALAAWRSKEVK